jgi:dihydroorotate dehydrogenase
MCITGMSKLGELGDYVVINISSPNTPGLRALQSKKQLEDLVVQVKVRNLWNMDIRPFAYLFLQWCKSR